MQFKVKSLLFASVLLIVVLFNNQLRPVEAGLNSDICSANDYDSCWACCEKLGWMVKMDFNQEGSGSCVCFVMDDNIANQAS